MIDNMMRIQDTRSQDIKSGTTRTVSNTKSLHKRGHHARADKYSFNMYDLHVFRQQPTPQLQRIPLF